MYMRARSLLWGILFATVLWILVFLVVFCR